MKSVTAIVLAFRDEPLLQRCVEAILASDGIAVGVVVVDNGCFGSAVKDIASLPGVAVVSPGTNLGFAGGCNAGSARATGEFIALINSDAIVTRSALAALVDGAQGPGVGACTGSLRLLQQPEAMNSAGNPVHFLGLSWAGSMGESAAAHATPRDVASVSGAAMLLPARIWRELGGFYEPLFAYQEDTELSLRIWQRGLRVIYVPTAVVYHDYVQNRHQHKYELLERNRLVIVLTIYGPRLLVLVTPALMALELVLLAMAARQGWLRQKLRGYAWLVHQRKEILRRRREVQAACATSEREFIAHLTPELFADDAGEFRVPGPIRFTSRIYWWVVKRVLMQTRVAKRK